MLRQKIVVGIVMLAVISTAGFVAGQESTNETPQSTSLFGQLDQFGKKLVGGIFPPKSDNTTQQKSTSNSNRYRRAAMQKGFNQQARDGSAIASKQNTAQARKYSRYKKPSTSSNMQPPKRRVMVTKPSNAGNKTTSQRKTAVAAAKSQPRKQDTVADKTVDSRPIHERLLGFSRSAFGGKPKQPASDKKVVPKTVAKDQPREKHQRVVRRTRQAVPKKDTAKSITPSKTLDNTDSDPDVADALSEALVKPKVAAQQTPVKTPSKTPITPEISDTKSLLADIKAGGKTAAPTKKSTPVKESETEKPVAKKPVAKKSIFNDTEKMSIEPKQLASKTVTPKKDVIKKAQPKAPQPKAARTEQASEAKDAVVLFERHSPMLNVRTMGPRHIVVDKESTYTVFMDNSGKAEAAEVVVTLKLPESADVLGADPSRGTTRSLRASNGSRQFEWRLGALAAGGSEKIALRIVPRKSRPIDMGITWDFKPAASQTVIEVQEPKLEMQLNGPREVAFGKDHNYKLEISNTGNGPAEDVAITLMPVAVGSGLPSTHQLGAFPAGKKMVLEIALTARQTEGLAVKVDLHNEGKICAQLNEKILVRKAELEMVANGPNMQYVGTVATYRIRLRNTGNADAKNLNIAVRIPSEAKYLSSDNGGKLIEKEGKAVWNVSSLSPGSEKIIELKCELVQAGFNRIDVKTTGDDQLHVSTAVATNVEAMADLMLEVNDPTGPVPVGTEAVYKLRIRNRGSKRAEGIEAAAYFSQGIEPVDVSGGQHKLGAGQVIFDGIDTLEAGQEVVYKITARADMPGNHMFRAEVHCKPLNTKLVSEETTHFFNGTLVADRPTVSRKAATSRQSASPKTGTLKTGRPTLAPRFARRHASKPPVTDAEVKQKPKSTVLQETRTADRRNLLTGANANPKSDKPPTQSTQEQPTGSRYRLEKR